MAIKTLHLQQCRRTSAADHSDHRKRDVFIRYNCRDGYPTIFCTTWHSYLCPFLFIYSFIFFLFERLVNHHFWFRVFVVDKIEKEDVLASSVGVYDFLFKKKRERQKLFTKLFSIKKGREKQKFFLINRYRYSIGEDVFLIKKIKKKEFFINRNRYSYNQIFGAAEQRTQGRTSTSLRITPWRERPRRGISFSTGRWRLA